MRFSFAAMLFMSTLAASATDRLEDAGGARDPVRIGSLSTSWGLTPAAVGIRDGLVALGYRENVDFYLGARFTRGDVTALPAAARELVGSGADIVLTAGANATQAAKLASDRVPIVFTAVGDPVGLGFVESLGRPGGNMTGVTDLDLELNAKRLEMFREMIPGLRRVLLVHDPMDAYTTRAAESYREAAARLGVELVVRTARGESAARALLGQVRAGEIDGIIASPYPVANIPALSLETALREGIPSMFPGGAFWTERGALVSYGPDFFETGRQAARLVHKILEGADPANIPVERNAKVELTVNLETATNLGLTIPSSVLARADRVID